MRTQKLRGMAVTVTVLAGLAAGRTASGASVTITLEDPTVTASAAEFKVDLAFAGSSGDLLNAIQLSVVGSDPALTGGGTDYSRFSFQLNTAAVPGWSELAPISLAGIDLIAPDEPTTGPFIEPTSGLLLGTLTIDLVGIAPGSSLFATLAGGSVATGDSTDAAGVVGGTPVDSFAQAGLLTATPDRVGFQSAAVPEPASLAMAVAPALVGVLLVVRRRTRADRRRVQEMASGKDTSLNPLPPA